MSQIVDTLRAQDPHAADALEIMALEYMRRRHEEGCSIEDDDKFNNGEFAAAAVAYAELGVEQTGRPFNTKIGPPAQWPFDVAKWKPLSLRFAFIASGVYSLIELTRMIRAGK